MQFRISGDKLSLVVDSDADSGDSVTLEATSLGFTIEVPLDLREAEELQHLLKNYLTEGAAHARALREQKALLGQS